MASLRSLIIFVAIFALILGVTHFYLYARIAYYLQPDPFQSAALAWGFVGVTLLVVIALPLSHLLPRRPASLISWMTYPWMGLSLLLLTGFLAADLMWLTLNIVGAVTGSAPSSGLQNDFGLAALSLVGALSLYALWNGMRPAYVRSFDVTLKKLPPSLDGLRLIQITDLHVGPMLGGAWLRRVVDQVNALEADIIAVTGDLVDGAVSELSAHVAPLGDLKAKHGAYFVTGNHEYYSGVDAWCEHIQSLDVRVLRNERVTLSVDGHALDIAGVDDWSSAHFPGKGHDLGAALEGRDNEKPLILLAHQPLAMHEAMEKGVDLQLSGHTHGGQIWPFSYLVRLQQPVVEGFFTYLDGDFQLYVSPGTGYWGPPMRLGTRAEITHITLRAAT